MVAESTAIPRLKKKYLEEVVPKTKEKFGLRNPHELPKIEKVIVNCLLLSA